MVRFQPDSWVEGLLRPLVMMDPQSGIYFEGIAPDWRFALIAGFALTAAVPGNRRKLSFEQRQLTLGLTASMLLWTFVIGNGRYFTAGLLLAGPLLIAAWRLIPGTPRLRYGILAATVALQLAVVASAYERNRWGLAQWKDHPALDIEASPLREQPATFITLTVISHSILVQRFHPQSRWSNIKGQHDITPTSREYAGLLNLLEDPLPKYVIWPISAQAGDSSLQPNAQLRGLIDLDLRPFGLALKPEGCVALRSNLAPNSLESPPRQGIMQGFWFCPAEYSEELRLTPQKQPELEPRIAEAFDSVERRCPRFFPIGSGQARHVDGLAKLRYYAGTDMKLVADEQDRILAKYHRALNPTFVGTIDQVRNGDFHFPCDKPSGRYQLPWQRD